MRSSYPWSAVVGQEELKRALLLCAIDPAIGGVLVKGPRGVGKTTLARSLSELCEGRFVELPLGASEERVTGTLDLEKVLKTSEVAFSPGLLAHAHDGVLYVDEVNLLPDALVDLLLDAAASGRNVVERDGISHVHPSRFVLVGTMNPDEGDLRPQLTDRFGLCVEAQEAPTPEERRSIVASRLSFDDDPERFVAHYSGSQHALIERCRRARARLRSIALQGPALEWVTERCHAAGVEGVRADLAMLRAARAHAAWEERSEIAREDVDAVAMLALAHRVHERPPSPPGGQAGGSKPPSRGASSSGGSPPPDHASRGTSQPPASLTQASSGTASGSSHDESAIGVQAGALRAVPVGVGPRSRIPAKLTASVQARAARRRGRSSVSSAHGARAELGGRVSVDWFATLSAAHPPTRKTLRFRMRRAPRSTLWILVLDCSASMLRDGALAAAKSVALALEAEARRSGAHMSLVTFSGASAQLALDSHVRPGSRTRTLRQLSASGGTPLRAALSTALSLCKTPQFANPQIAKRLFVLTDGRSHERIAVIAAPNTSALVLDCERGVVRLGRASAVARALGADLVHVDSLAAS